MGEFEVTVDVCKFCPRLYMCNRENCTVKSFSVELDYRNGFAKVKIEFKD